MSANPTVPVLKDEINRKAFQAIKNLLSRYSAGQISEGQLKVGMEGVWDCVVGICSDDVFKLLSEMADNLISYDKDLRFFINSKGAMVCIERYLDSDKVIIKSDFDHKDLCWNSITQKEFENEISGCKVAKEFVEKLVAKLKTALYVEI